MAPLTVAVAAVAVAAAVAAAGASDEMHGLEVLDADDAQVAARRLALHESEPEHPGLQKGANCILGERDDAAGNRTVQEPIADVDQMGQDQKPHPSDHPLGAHSGVIGWGAKARLEGDLEKVPGRSGPLLDDSNVEDLELHGRKSRRCKVTRAL